MRMWLCMGQVDAKDKLIQGLNQGSQSSQLGSQAGAWKDGGEAGNLCQGVVVGRWMVVVDWVSLVGGGQGQ